MYTHPSTSLVQARAARRAGFSMVEIAVLTVLLLIAIGGLSSAVLSSVRLSRATEENVRASDALRAQVARMQTVSFASIFRQFNVDPEDDRDGPGSAPGATFPILGLTPRTGDPDGVVGRIVFPSVPTGVGTSEQLREDVLDERLGMPRDLNGNGTDVDGLDGDYLVLPVRLIAEWTGTSGNRLMELDVLLVP